MYIYIIGGMQQVEQCAYIYIQQYIYIEVVIEQKDHLKEINQAYTLSLSNSFHMLDLSATNQKISNQNIICICANIIILTYFCNYLHTYVYFVMVQMQYKNTKFEKTFQLSYYFNNSRETKEMMASQTKLSVDTSKEVQADPSLKSKVSIIFFYKLPKNSLFLPYFEFPL